MIDRFDCIDRYVADRTRANRDAVITAHLYLCRRGARKFRRAESEIADLEQIAAIGLVKAVDAYCAERTTPFEAYAWIVIVGELMHYVRDHERPIRIPRSLRALERRYVAQWEILAAVHHTEPTTAQLASALGVSCGQIEELQALRRAAPLDPEMPSGKARKRATANAGISLEERVTIAMAVEELPQRERTIVLGTFGRGLSQAEIAMLLGLSQSQVSKILARALGKLSAKVA